MNGTTRIETYPFRGASWEDTSPDVWNDKGRGRSKERANERERKEKKKKEEKITRIRFPTRTPRSSTIKCLDEKLGEKVLCRRGSCRGNGPSSPGREVSVDQTQSLKSPAKGDALGAVVGGELLGARCGPGLGLWADHKELRAFVPAAVTGRLAGNANRLFRETKVGRGCVSSFPATCSDLDSNSAARAFFAGKKELLFSSDFQERSLPFLPGTAVGRILPRGSDSLFKKVQPPFKAPPVPPRHTPSGGFFGNLCAPAEADLATDQVLPRELPDIFLAPVEPSFGNPVNCPMNN